MVSVIIPTKNSVLTIGRCIKSLLAQRYSPVEIIVVDGESLDATCEISASLGSKVYRTRMERSQARNFGARMAKGEYLLFVDSDMVTEPDLVGECLAHCGYRTACVIPQKTIGRSFWSKCVAIGETLRQGDTTYVAPRFMSKGLFSEAKGYDETLVYGEDKDLHSRLLSSGVKMVFVGSQIYHIDNLSIADRTRKIVYYGKKIPQYRARHRSRSMYHILLPSPRYIKKISLVSNPWYFFGFVFLKLVEYESFIAGAMFNRV